MRVHISPQFDVIFEVWIGSLHVQYQSITTTGTIYINFVSTDVQIVAEEQPFHMMHGSIAGMPLHPELCYVFFMHFFCVLTVQT